jgi:hypothetical protein
MNQLGRLDGYREESLLNKLQLQWLERMEGGSHTGQNRGSKLSFARAGGDTFKPHGHFESRDGLLQRPWLVHEIAKIVTF